MIVLYLVSLIPLTLVSGSYISMGYGEYCSGTGARITNTATCKSAAAALGYRWGASWWGPYDFAGCLHTRDHRNQVYFNLSPHASRDPMVKPHYAEICSKVDPPVHDGEWSGWGEWSSCAVTCGDEEKTRTRTCTNPPPSNGGNPCVGKDKETHSCDLPACEYVWCSSFGIETTDTWLVVTGGDNSGGRLKSTEIVTATGVCDPIPPTTIPPLDMATSAGEMTFMQNRNLLVFCGGSTTFVHDTVSVDAWGATNDCYALPTVAPNAWSKTLVPPMNQERAWFSLSKVNSNEIIAVGGIDNSGVATDSMEKYSFITNSWTYLPSNLPHQRFGHCTVHYFTGGKSYLIVIGGSKEVSAGDSWEAVKTVFKVDVATSATTQLADLPEALFRPACTISCGGEIYVSGGSVGTTDYTASKKVYRYSCAANAWSHVGDMNNARWGHVMGVEGAYADRKLSVAGGYSGDQPGGNVFRNSVEDSINGGVTWTKRRTNLLVGREYAASAEVPASTFTCQG